MAIIKSSSDHLTINADGASKDIKFQANGVEKASISSAGAFTSTSIDATKLTGNLPAISGANLTNLPAGGVDGITSSADATAITINSSEQVGIGVTPTVPLQIRTALSSIGQTTPETVLMLETTAGSGDMAVGNGTRILFKISDDETNPSVGASIDAVRANGDDSISSTDLVFSTSQNDETLDEALRIDSSGNVRITGTLGNGNYRTNSANIAAAAKTITISDVQTLSPGNHWDSFGIEITVDGIDGGAGNNLSKKWRHHCDGLSTWSLPTPVEIWGGTPFTTAKTSSNTTDLVMTVTGAPANSVIRVEVYSHSMNSGCNITFS